MAKTGFDFNNRIPTEEDFREVAEAKGSNDKSRALGGSSCIDDSEAPYYYLLIRRFFACLLLKWTETAKAAENLILNDTDGLYSKEIFKTLINTMKLHKDQFIEAYNKYKAAQDISAPTVTFGKKKNHEVTPAEQVNDRAGEVKITTHGKTKDFYRIVAYDMRYGGSGARRGLVFGKKEGNLYTIKILGSDQMIGLRLYDSVFFKTINEAKLFIANINHSNINTSYEIDSLRYCISDEPINTQHYNHLIGKYEYAVIDNLNDAVQVNTMCGKAYILKKSEQCKESLEIDNMNEAIEKHDTLNPKLFNGNTLKPEIRKKAEEVVNEFLRILAEDEVRLDVRDVILTGSNASYNYTADSDVDLHILASTAQFDDPEQLHKKLYNCYRRIFESKFDISFYGIPVEVYVETEDNPVVSNGIYSVMYDKWVKEPTQDYVKDVDQEEIAKFAKPWIDRANEVIKKVDDNLPDGEEEIDKYLEDIYEMRQQGIYNTEGSEFSPENLAFKEVRNAGLLDRLKDLKNRVIERRLSLEEAVGYLDDAHEFKDYGTAEVEGGNVIDTTRASTFATQDLLDHSEDAAYEGVVYDIVDLTPIQYFELCSKVQGMSPEDMMEYIKSDERQLAHIKDVILKYHKRLQMPYVSFSKMSEVAGQEGRHRMYALGEMFGWDKEFPVMVVQDLGAKKTIGELLHESINEDFRLSEKERRDYFTKIAQIAHTQPVVHNNGIFEIYNVKEEDSMNIVGALSKESWTEWVQRTAGRYDFGDWKTFAKVGLPGRLYTIRGKIKIAPVHELVFND